MQISDIDGLADAIRGAGSGQTLSFDPSIPGWGFLRVFQETAGTNWEEVGRFEGPAVNGTTAFPPGAWSIHNTEVWGDHAYASWYSAGIIALDLSDPTDPQMVGQFVPKGSKKGATALGPGPAHVRGSQSIRTVGCMPATCEQGCGSSRQSVTPRPRGSGGCYARELAEQPITQARQAIESIHTVGGVSPRAGSMDGW
jgi:hypothetical protein